MKANPVTEDRLKEILEDYPTKNDLKEILDERFDKLNNRLDEVMGELETVRQEQTIGYHQFKELEEKVEKQETKINALTSSQS